MKGLPKQNWHMDAPAQLTQIEDGPDRTGFEKGGSVFIALTTDCVLDTCSVDSNFQPINITRKKIERGSMYFVPFGQLHAGCECESGYKYVGFTNISISGEMPNNTSQLWLGKDGWYSNKDQAVKRE